MYHRSCVISYIAYHVACIRYRTLDISHHTPYVMETSRLGGVSERGAEGCKGRKGVSERGAEERKKQQYQTTQILKTNDTQIV